MSKSMTIEERTKVYEILKSFSTAMFIAVDPDGKLTARPMHVAGVGEETGEVWFFTNRSGRLATAIPSQSRVILVFENENSAYLSLQGTARIDPDKSRAKELWTKAYKVWFPAGLEDPELTLLSVHLVGAEYWDNRGMNKLAYLFEAANAYATGTTPDLPEGDQHGKTTL